MSETFTILFNRTGDVALSWESPEDSRVLTFIQQKMNEGYVFFILDDEFFTKTGRKKVALSVNDLPRGAANLFLDDSEAERLVAEGTFDLIKLTYESGKELPWGRRAKTAKEAAGKKTAAFRPKSGG